MEGDCTTGASSVRQAGARPAVGVIPIAGSFPFCKRGVPRRVLKGCWLGPLLGSHAAQGLARSSREPLSRRDYIKNLRLSALTVLSSLQSSLQTCKISAEALHFHLRPLRRPCTQVRVACRLLCILRSYSCKARGRAAALANMVSMGRYASCRGHPCSVLDIIHARKCMASKAADLVSNENRLRAVLLGYIILVVYQKTIGSLVSWLS